MSSSRIRLVDLDEHDLVILARSTGEVTAEVSEDACGAALAHVLRDVARRLVALHMAQPCETAPTEPRETVRIDGGHLDGDQYTDGRGQPWDLSRPWDDAAGGRWHFEGRVDALGAPMLRSTVLDDQWPLDVVDAVYGPITPVAGDAS